MSQRMAHYEDELEGEDEDFLGGLANIASQFLGEEELEVEGELEAEEELEGMYASEFEDELEGEEFLGGLANVAGQLLGEEEVEGEDEQFWGGLAKVAGSLLGEGEDEWEDEDELEAEMEAEAEDEAEEFFKSIGRFVRKHSGVLKKIAKVAAPLVATAVGGPAAGALARAVTSQLEGETELEGELEGELEAELEEMAAAAITPQQALAERLAAKAAMAHSEGEAEAFAGGAVSLTLSRRDRRQLQQLLPALMHGSAVLTKVLYRNPQTRNAIRFVPGIADAAGGTVARRAAMGYPVRKADVGTALAQAARRVLGHPRYTLAAGRRHARGLAYARQFARRQARLGHRSTTGRSIYRAPSRTVVQRQTRGVARPRPGVVRVVTPVRLPGRNGAPPRTVRVVSDLRLPPGARPTGRPATITARGKR